MLLKDFNEIPKVRILDIDVPDFHRDLLRTIAGALSYQPKHDPMLFGGAPRDNVYNNFIRPADICPIIPRDYDVIVRAPDHLYNDETISGKVNAESSTKHALDNLRDFEGFENAEILEPAYGFEAGRIVFQYDSKNIEVLVTRPWHPNDSFVEDYTDAPINGIATTLSGQTLVQLECIDHLQNQIYRFSHSVSTNRFLERMRKMREHYPHVRGILSPTNAYDEKALIEYLPEVKKEGLLIMPNDPDYRRFIGEGIHALDWHRNQPIHVTLQL